MTLRGFVVPLWQSCGDRAVGTGADALADALSDAPGDSWTELGAPRGEGSGDDPAWLRHGDQVGGYLAAVADLLDAVAPGPSLAVGGGRSVELPFIADALHTYHDDLVVLWCDAEASLHTPETSPSGLADSMALRVLLGDGDPRLTGLVSPVLLPRQLVLVGTRAADSAEWSYVAERSIAHVAEDGRADSLGLQVASSGARHAYVHVDLSVLDPGLGVPVPSPVPRGLTTLELAAGLVSALRDVVVVGIGITGTNASGVSALHAALPLLRDLRALLTVAGTSR